MPRRKKKNLSMTQKRNQRKSKKIPKNLLIQSKPKLTRQLQHRLLNNHKKKFFLMALLSKISKKRRKKEEKRKLRRLIR